MAKPIRAQELHYPMIQFLINIYREKYVNIINWFKTSEVVQHFITSFVSHGQKMTTLIRQYQRL